MSSTRSPDLCVALDLPTLDEALALVNRLVPEVVWFKVGLELFTASGPEAIRSLRARGLKVFLDLKLHDIPETVARTTSVAGMLGVDLLTLHAVAGAQAMRAAAAISGRPRLVAVTKLTSEAAGAAEVIERGREALSCGVDGLVASGKETRSLRAALGKEFFLVTPGVRIGSDAHDHVRVSTPSDAARAGADLLVVGRPIRDAADPRAVARSILAEIRRG